MKSNLKRVDFVNKTLIPDKSEGNVASLDEGYFRLATSIGNLKPKLKMSGHEHQVFDAVIMCTFGWNKSEDKVTNTYLAEMTELDDSDINKALNKLANRRVINLRKSGGFKIVSVNKNLNDWILNRQKTLNTKTPKKMGESSHKVGRFDTSSLEVSPNTKDSLTKDNNINNSSSENSNESSDRPSEKFLAVKPDAVVSSPKGNKWGNADDLKAAKWIYSQVLIVSPTTKEPNWSTWANDVRLMRQLDGHTHQDICKMFKWANMDSFWYSNVLSPAKLREKWATLVIQSQQPSRTQRVAEQAPAQSWNTREAWENEFI
ncbi:replication protein [Providencia rettgeri]|uniref:replication protein n=1 Tax=Providencia rettgeri TaxID=587 RepID=UPI001B365D1A|nr:replication protein [Providencia rettgeri]MBQ0364965.1 replication protein [Providencia rettgeri]